MPNSNCAVTASPYRTPLLFYLAFNNMVESHSKSWKHLTDKIKQKYMHIGLIVLLIVVYLRIPLLFRCTASGETCNHSHSITNMNLTIIRSFLVTLIALQVMIICEMNIVPTLTSIGVAMAALSYVFIDQLKDLITGMTLLYSNNIRLGEMVQLQIGYAKSFSEPMQVTDFYTTVLACREENDNIIRYIPYRQIIQYRKITQ